MEDKSPSVMQLADSAMQDYSTFQKYSNVLTNITEDASNPYDSWCRENGAPLSCDDIKVIIDELVAMFGFQKDNGANIYELLMTQLDSRASRMACTNSLLSLHADYVGGSRSNYKKWYFASHFELDHNITKKNYEKAYRMYLQNVKFGNSTKTNQTQWDLHRIWNQQMAELSYRDQVVHISLYLLIWGEANNLRFMPEFICFIFKCALDYYTGPRTQPAMNFLDDIVTPVYQYIKGQQYKLLESKWVRNGKDHHQIIGYDDINQFFWLPETISKLALRDKSLLYSYPKETRMLKLKEIDWNKPFYKTYMEKRSWIHVLTNFNRIWIIHVSTFWYYTSFNSPTLYTKGYAQLLNNQPPAQVTWTICALGGFLACLISFFAAISELIFCPRKWPGTQPVFGRIVLLAILGAINVAPSVYILLFLELDVFYRRFSYLAIGQFVVSLITTLYLSIETPTRYFSFLLPSAVNHEKIKTFVADFPAIPTRGRSFSVILWISVFLFKFCESYFFLTLSVKDPARVLSIMTFTRCHGDVWLGAVFCRYQARITLVVLYVTDLVLFFLDTYLWYIICNCLFSIGLSFSTGVSVFTPWKNVFARLPERIFCKISSNSQNKFAAISEVWNQIIFSMFKEHLISADQMSHLIYAHQFTETDLAPSSSFIKEPPFFIFQDDNAVNIKDFIHPNGEAERRISFFAHSLSCPIPEPIPVNALPTFTVLVPHYSETILLSLKEVIRQSEGSRISVLDYLKMLKRYEWEMFVQDTRVLSASSTTHTGNEPDNSAADPNSLSTTIPNKSAASDILDDIPLYCMGFKNSSYENTLRTRIWASLRTQTLYRTISGFMNYETALKVLSRVETPTYSDEHQEDIGDRFVSRKFKLLVSMQRFQNFSDKEMEDAEQLFASFPNLQVAYIEEQLNESTKEIEYYSVLLDAHNKTEDGQYIKRFRIKLSGNPIIGDGKSDNQNHAIVFYRGEYIQVIDANQDNYLEECLKIKSVLAEFEEFTIEHTNCYSTGPQAIDQVAIVGAREYIFSENIGALGDIAAAKEQTFGTLFARTLAEIGGKLHYGHPDFINAIFMNTRGGISKAQKGLHLNEDIYAGMLATSRGGRIKHCDYYQCGKGRDLGFGSILNFTIKIGAGMGEQLLSRDHFYLGTNLPIDRFLSFYYAHAGFHLNNLFIGLSVALFMAFLVCLGSIFHEAIICQYDPSAPITDFERPLGCYNIAPVLQWVNRFVLSVFICFFISFLPLVFQELVSKGILKALSRILYHITSFSPLFEVFVSQIYSVSLRDNLSLGGAQYIPTGRGFAMSRVPFCTLYSKYAAQSIYKGTMILIIVIFTSTTMWQPSILWFWITCISMCLAPFLFNPHQFVWSKFFLDYREYLRWLFRGNSKKKSNSWYSYQKAERAKYVGYKRRVFNQAGVSLIRGMRWGKCFRELVVIPAVTTALYFMCYFFINSQNGVSSPQETNLVLRMLLLALIAPLLNMLISLGGVVLSCTLGPLLGCCCGYATSISFVSRVLAVAIILVNVELLLYLEGWNLSRSLVGIVLLLNIHRLLRGFVYTFFLSKELRDDSVNLSWWSGSWIKRGLGFMVLSQPLRELIVKTIEQCQFGYDFIIGHCLLFVLAPILLVPFVDRLQTAILFWARPSAEFRETVRSRRVKRRNRLLTANYFVIFVFMLVLFAGFLLIPIFSAFIPDIKQSLPTIAQQLFQPTRQNNNDTGEQAPLSILRQKPGVKIMSTVD